MLCDACKKREAVVHIVKIEDGQRTDVHLCATCAKRQSNFSNMRDVNIIDNDFSARWLIPIIREIAAMNRAVPAAA